MEYPIRLATCQDADAISRVVISALKESNAQDYSPEVIANVMQNFSSQVIVQLMSRRQMHVATLDQRVVATASLDGGIVRSVFVEPAFQGHGIGKQLMAVIENCARNAGLPTLLVPSSITAEGFYAALGFQRVRDEFHGAERTIVMRKALDQERLT